jgi:hypothetical protein
MSFATVTLAGPATVCDGLVLIQGFALEWPMNWALPADHSDCVVQAVIRPQRLLVVRVFAGADYDPIDGDNLVVIDLES